MPPPEKPDWPIASGIELIQDLSGVSPPNEGFLRRHRHALKTLLDDGTRTDVYIADYIDRDPGKRDAVAVALYSPGETPSAAKVWLRRQVRYAQSLITGHPLCVELIAGVVEAGETALETAHREVWEEAGVELPIEAVTPLGQPFFVLPGTLTERVHPFAARVEDPAVLEAAQASLPPGDGSAFEEGAHALVLRLDEVFALADAPFPDDPAELWLQDAKTELVLRRLRDRLGDAT